MRLAAAIPALLAGAPALAEVPRVLADTPPVHSLVAIVMGDLGEPALVVRSGTSPHDSALSPSQAEALTEPDLIVWTGPTFLPWMEEAIAALAPEARTLALLEAEGWDALPARESLHLGEEGHEEGHGHDHDHDHGHDHDHSEGAIDPHAWLDPAVAADWLGLIAEALAAEDPGNAAAYRANAEAGAAEMARLGEDLRARLGPLAGVGYAVGHDAYQYLERAAGLPANWAVARADGAAAAPGDVAALRDAVLAGEVSCLLLDAETDPAWAATLGEGAELRTASVDPDGVALEPGPGLYPALVEGIAAALEGCLAP
jgi:zinc transport system substrate-binding protein